MKIPKEILEEISWMSRGAIYDEPDDDIGPIEIMEKKIVGTGRWTINYEQVFKLDGKFYRTTFEEGATENQDTRAYEYEKDLIEVTEVVAVVKEVTVYETL